MQKNEGKSWEARDREFTRIHKLEESEKCVSRESNAGPIDGNDGFYH